MTSSNYYKKLLQSKNNPSKKSIAIFSDAEGHCKISLMSLFAQSSIVVGIAGIAQ